MKEKLIKQLLIANTILLVIPLFPDLDLPYGYFTLLRLSICGTFGYITYKEFKEEKINLINILLAALFNPIIPISLDQVTWQQIDCFTALYCVILFFKHRTKQKTTPLLDQAIIKSCETASILRSVCSKYNGIINKIPDEFQIIINIANMQRDYSIMTTGNPTKFAMNKDFENVYICKHLWSKPAGSNHENKTIIDYKTDYLEDVTINDLYNTCDGDLHMMILFVLDNRSSHINMDNFNEILLPQFETEFRASLIADEIMKQQNR